MRGGFKKVAPLNFMASALTELKYDDLQPITSLNKSESHPTCSESSIAGVEKHNFRTTSILAATP
jgi:hypothetical protein